MDNNIVNINQNPVKMGEIQKAGNEISGILESHKLHELEALMALEFVKISIEASIMKKAAVFETK